MDISTAQAVIQAEAAKLTAAFRAKGYSLSVEIWINRSGIFHPGVTGMCTLYAHDLPASISFGYGYDLAELIAKAHADIAALPLSDAVAYADELSGPLFLMSEQHDQAAE
jgi:hypothetical protein